MKERTIPVSLVERLATMLEKDAACLESYGLVEQANLLRRPAQLLDAAMNDPTHRWVTVAEAAGQLGCSEETVRRQCRQGSAAFRFKREGKQYYIWLPDILTEVNSA